VTGPDVDNEFDEVEFVDEFGGDEPSAPWHNSTRAVIGASVAGVVVIGVLGAAVMYVTGQDDGGAPVNFVDPSFSATASRTPATTTTATITSTAPLSTTEINAPLAPPTTSGSTTSGSAETSSSGTESSISPPPTRPRQRETDESPGGPTSRRPRFNVTRTLQPQQPG
jgi:hypothetical protein